MVKAVVYDRTPTTGGKNQSQRPPTREGGFSHKQPPPTALADQMIAFTVVGPFLGLGKIKLSASSGDTPEEMPMQPRKPNAPTEGAKISRVSLNPQHPGESGVLPGNFLNKNLREVSRFSKAQTPGLRIPRHVPFDPRIGGNPSQRPRAIRQVTRSEGPAARGKGGHRPQRSPDQAKQGASRSWREVVFVSLSDFMLVMVSLWVVFTLALIIAAFQEPQGLKSGIEHWLTLRPVAFLVSVKPWMGGVGILGIYFCYVVMFRLFVGQTPGRLLRKRPQGESWQGIGASEPRRNSL